MVARAQESVPGFQAPLRKTPARLMRHPARPARRVAVLPASVTGLTNKAAKSASARHETVGKARPRTHAGRRQAAPAGPVAQVLPEAEFARRRGSRQMLVFADRAEPLERLRRNLMHANLHGRANRTERALQKGCRGSLFRADKVICFSNVKYLEKRLSFVLGVSFGTTTLRLEPLGPDLDVFSVREDQKIFVGFGKSQCACRVGSPQASPHGNPREEIDVDNA